MTKDIKLIITDLDHTFLRSDRTISEFSINVVRQCQRQGIIFGVATARSEMSAKSYTDVIEPDLLVSSGGALARYQGDILYEKTMSSKTSDGLIQDLLNNKNIGDITVETQNDYYWNYSDVSKLDKDFSHATYHDFKQTLGCATYKITVEVFCEQIVAELLKKYPEVQHTPFRGEVWGRFAHKHANKIDAIRVVAKSLGINKNQIVTFGDDSNDVGMIEYFNGVAVANAIQEVKTVAGFMAKSNDQDGVAWFIKDKFL